MTSCEAEGCKNTVLPEHANICQLCGCVYCIACASEGVWHDDDTLYFCLRPCLYEKRSPGVYVTASEDSDSDESFEDIGVSGSESSLDDNMIECCGCGNCLFLSNAHYVCEACGEEYCSECVEVGNLGRATDFYLCPQHMTK